jgi:hypothetical protein
MSADSACGFVCVSNLVSDINGRTWSELLATDPEARVRFPALPDFLGKKKKKKKKRKKVVDLERGPLSLLSTTEELLDRKVAAPV